MDCTTCSGSCVEDVDEAVEAALPPEVAHCRGLGVCLAPCAAYTHTQRVSAVQRTPACRLSTHLVLLARQLLVDLGKVERVEQSCGKRLTLVTITASCRSLVHLWRTQGANQTVVRDDNHAKERCRAHTSAMNVDLLSSGSKRCEVSGLPNSSLNSSLAHTTQCTGFSGVLSVLVVCQVHSEPKGRGGTLARGVLPANCANGVHLGPLLGLAVEALGLPLPCC